MSNTDEENKLAAEKLITSSYVDNCVTSVASVSELENFISKSTEIVADAKIDLRMWEFKPIEEVDKSFFNKKELLNKDVTTSVPVLDLQCSRKDDCLQIPHKYG